MKFGTGVLFIAIGVLSYLLPLLGRQFVIIWLLNAVTFGLGGIICIVIGVAIIFLAMKQQKKAFAERPIQVDPRWQENNK
jgi:positive regulator of sigma E activity